MSELWKKLYVIADQLHAVRPWESIDEQDWVGVEDPATREIGFLQVMGHLGEHFAISRYPGTAGLALLHELYSTDMDDPAAGSEKLLNSHQLQLSWEDGAELDKSDKKLIKELGLKYRGRHTWPLFRSYEPMRYPWFLTQAQAETLLVALEQYLEFYKELQEDRALFADLGDDDYWVRFCKDGQWHSEIRKIFPASEERRIVSQIPSLPKLKALPKAKGAALEIDLMIGPPIKGGEADGRPFFPYLLLMADAKTGTIFPGVEFIQPIPSVDAMYGTIAEKVCASIVNCGATPEEIRVRRDILAGVLAPLEAELGVRVKLQDQLPAAQEAIEGLGSFMGRG